MQGKLTQHPGRAIAKKYPQLGKCKAAQIFTHQSQQAGNGCLGAGLGESIRATIPGPSCLRENVGRGDLGKARQKKENPGEAMATKNNCV